MVSYLKEKVIQRRKMSKKMEEFMAKVIEKNPGGTKVPSRWLRR